MALSRRSSRPGPERGAVAVWVSVALPAFVLCVGLGVDLAGHAQAEQQARFVAREAARAAGQQIQVLDSGVPGLNRTAATVAAAAYLDDHGYSGRTSVSGGVVNVEVSGSYDTMFLGMIGVHSLPLHATGTAAALSVIAGVTE